jgi:hypothetical protein
VGRTGEQGWWASDLACLSSSRMPYVADRSSLTTALVQRLDDGPGFAIVTGVPLDGLSLEEACDLAPQLLSELGEPFLQGPRESARVGWLIRNERSSRSQPAASDRDGVSTSTAGDHLAIHNEGAMRPYGYEIGLFALLCVESAPEGGETILVSGRTVIDVLRRDHPAHLDRLRRPFAFGRAQLTRPGQAPVSWGPVFEEVGGRVRVRYSRQRIEMAPSLSGIPLTCGDVAALDALDEILCRPELQFRHRLSPGEFLVVDNHRVLHGRSGFTDDCRAGRQRCLVRVLLARRAEPRGDGDGVQVGSPTDGVSGHRPPS